MSDDEDVPEPSSIKRHRTDLTAEDTVILEEASLPTPEQEGNADGVKEVTKGVREVELEVWKPVFLGTKLVCEWERRKLDGEK